MGLFKLTLHILVISKLLLLFYLKNNLKFTCYNFKQCISLNMATFGIINLNIQL